MLDCYQMAYQKRASAPTNTVRLTLDYDTLDRLRTIAAERRIDMTRCAYELLQETLGMRARSAAASTPTAPAIADTDESAARLRRATESFESHYQPKRTA